MGRVKKEEDLGPEADENWKSKDPKALAYEIATFMGGSWPTRPVRKVQLSLDGVPTVRLRSALLSLYRFDGHQYAPTGGKPGGSRDPINHPTSTHPPNRVSLAREAFACSLHPSHASGSPARHGVQRTARRSSRCLPTRSVLSCHQDDEELFELTKLNPTLLSEMSTKTRFLFLEVYYDDLQDVYSEVMETLVGDMVRSWRPIPKRAPTGINRPCRHEPRIARRAHGAGGSRPLALAPHVGMTTSALNREAATAHAAAHWLPSGRANSKGCTKTARRQLHSWLRRLGGRGALRL